MNWFKCLGVILMMVSVIAAAIGGIIVCAIAGGYLFGHYGAVIGSIMGGLAVITTFLYLASNEGM